LLQSKEYISGKRDHDKRRKEREEKRGKTIRKRKTDNRNKGAKQNKGGKRTVAPPGKDEIQKEKEGRTEITGGTRKQKESMRRKSKQ